MDIAIACIGHFHPNPLHQVARGQPAPASKRGQPAPAPSRLQMPGRQLCTEIEIDAEPARVRAVFTDFQGVNSWQRWLQFNQPASAADLQPGLILDITLTAEGASPFKMQPKVIANTPDEFRWRGKLMNVNWLFMGEHWFKFEGLPGGRTRFVHGEDFSGWLIPLAGGTLDKANVEFARFNVALKKQVEGL